MNSIKILFICAISFNCLFAIINCAVSFSPNATHPDHPNQCWSKEHNKAIDPAETFYVDCQGYTCVHGDDDSYGLRIFGCGVVAVDAPGCHVRGIDNTKPYPECCPAPVCN